MKTKEIHIAFDNEGVLIKSDLFGREVKGNLLIKWICMLIVYRNDRILKRIDRNRDKVKATQKEYFKQFKNATNIVSTEELGVLGNDYNHYN